MSINPFFELYVGDKLSSREFVDIFSPFLVKHTEALFVPGNVVVKGIQGSGKSMLLSLLRSEVRKQYASTGTDFPVPRRIRKFIGAGINLAHSNAIDFGYRAISNDESERALYFADFVNYRILIDLFESLRTLSTIDATESHNVDVCLSPDRTSAFVSELSAADVFQGTLKGSVSLEDVEARLRTRLNAYRRFLHLNDEKIDPLISQTKTDIGQPIAKTVSLLKASEIILPDVPVFIHVDQYEELANISPQETNSPDYRRVINRAFARRDPTISYRIGTRGHAWRNHGFVFGSQVKLEEERDYKFIDLDGILRRHENPKTWVFPRFAEDVFARRLRHAGLASKEAQGKELLQRMFGRGLAPKDKALKYGGTNPRRSVKADPDWPKEFQDSIADLAESDPLSARLLEAWVLQQLARADSSERTVLLRTLSMDMLSAMRKKRWWIKERQELALVQIAGRCQQRPIWAGTTEIIDLSGGNILTFLSICQSIWDTQSQLSRKHGRNSDLIEIDVEVQAIGIFKASAYWLHKVMQESGNSGNRFRLARQIGNTLMRELYADRKMSYPGHNGFSLADDELDRYPHVRALIEEMGDYGTVLVWPHTTKERNRRRRHKVYLNPVLCPQFKMHYQRLKEPLYIRPNQVEKWMDDAGLELPNSYRSEPPEVKQTHLPLFDDKEDSL
ncbi:hypothetical protein F4X86_01670 [Candidatus Saccharibacteria bacterium]|nr:hypothetical protein [Gammaproteobacteria bacterium]MYB39989.1 hypothetical protein [Candidatus Saccharibacteria bacterium]